VRIKQSSLTKSLLEQIQARLAARDFHPRAKEYTFGSFFDERLDRFVIATDASADVMEPLLRAYPNAIALR
jgi:hypothetical protein